MLEFILGLPPFPVVVGASLLVGVVSVLLYKWMTNQVEMKRMKDEIKELQKKAKAAKDNADEMMAANKRMMEVNGKYMMASMKPTLLTFLPIILIFGWLQGHYSYEPLSPGQEFLVTLSASGYLGDVTVSPVGGLLVVGDSTKTFVDGKTVFTFKGEAGDYIVDFKTGNETVSQKIVISGTRNYEGPVFPIKDSKITEVALGNKDLIVMNLFGWQLGWLGTYIIFSIVFSLVLRKLLNVY